MYSILTNRLIFSLLLFTSFLAGCQKDGIDREPPKIDIAFSDAFPVQCSVLERGETFVVRVRFTDNVALGSFSIDIHHNFDHHSHTTEAEECDLGEEKQAVNPFEFIRSYDIPTNSTAYETNVEVVVPEDVDPGDYHFMIQATDKEGWSSRIGLSIKVN